MPLPKPVPALDPGAPAYATTPLVKATGFREYDARWILDKDINLAGIEALGLGLGTYIHEIGVQPRIVVGHDYRSYSETVKAALIKGVSQLLLDVLKKPLESTFVIVEEVATDNWGWGGLPVREFRKKLARDRAASGS